MSERRDTRSNCDDHLAHGGRAAGRRGGRRAIIALISSLTLALLATPAAALPGDDWEPPYEEPGDPPADTRPPAAFTWTMPDRFGYDSNGDGLVDYFTGSDVCPADPAQPCHRQPPTNPAPIKPAGWHVDLNACGSRYGDPAGAVLTWRVIAGAGAVISGGPGCGGFDLDVPAEGVYGLELTVTSSLGTATATQDVVVQDWLIVSLGDSYGSGEGNPDIEMQRNDVGIEEAPAVWQDNRCHRTANAGSALAAIWLERADPKTSVTFIHLACSGAQAVTGLLEAYTGVHGPPETARMEPLPPQVDEARRLVDGREVDSVYLSVGGNDSNFAHIVMSCIALAPCNPVHVTGLDVLAPDVFLAGRVCLPSLLVPPPFNYIFFAVCAGALSTVLGLFAGQTAEHWFRDGLIGEGTAGDIGTYQLTGIYDRLDTALFATNDGGVGRPFLGLPERHRNRVLISEYVDATTDDDGDYCPKWPLLPHFNDLRVPALGLEEYAWIDTHVEQKLNEAIAWNASQRQWRLVDGIHARYYRHGLCADDTYMRGLLPETFWVQGDMNGAAHPNQNGHRVYRDRTISQLLSSLYPDPTGSVPDIRSSAQVASWVRAHAPRRPEPPPAIAPVAEAGGPYTVAEGATTTAVNASQGSSPLASMWTTSNASVATVAPPDATTPTITGVDDGTATLTLGVSDDADPEPEATDTAPVTVTNVAPTVTTGVPPGELVEGQRLDAIAGYADPGALDTHIAAVDYGDGTIAAPVAVGGRVALAHSYVDDDADDQFAVTVDVSDDDGGTGTAAFPVTVRNAAPIVDAGPAVQLQEGQSLARAATYADPGTLDTHTAAVDYGDGATAAPVAVGGRVSLAHTYTDDGNRVVTVAVTDDDGDTSTATLPVTVANAAPVVDPLTAPTAPVRTGTAIAVTTRFTDAGADAHTVTWAWGDGTTTVEQRAAGQPGTLAAQHTYAAAGLYAVAVTVDDGDGGMATRRSEPVVVYNPAGGLTTGTGIIDSAPGALRTKPQVSGAATFALLSAYPRSNATAPSGALQFRLGTFVVTSTSQQWLVVTGNRAWFTGAATVNGQAGYRFLVAVLDGNQAPATNQDRLRLKVWNAADGSVVYDNQLGAAHTASATTAIKAGVIVVAAR